MKVIALLMALLLGSETYAKTGHAGHHGTVKSAKHHSAKHAAKHHKNGKKKLAKKGAKSKRAPASVKKSAKRHRSRTH
jgi:hypothetical protein